MNHRASRSSSPNPRLVELLDWRQRRLERGGFATPLASALAADPRLDLHALLELVDRGCPPELAARILAPIDDGRQEPA